MKNIEKKRLEEIIYNILYWGGEHDDEFYDSLIYASGMTKKEANKVYGSNIMSEKRLEEVINNVFGWGGEHDEEFMQCLVDAADLTLEEAVHFEVEEYHEDYEQEDERYNSTYDNEEIAQALDMSYTDDDPASYDGWNYLSLLHDYNDGRGEEWVDVFEEQGLDSGLLDRYKKLVNYDEEEED